LVRLAREGWKRDHPPHPSLRIGPPEEPQLGLSVSAKQGRAAWARLIKKVFEADPLSCPRCQKPMEVIAVLRIGILPQAFSAYFNNLIGYC
jgi:hypothetical protein